MTTFSQQSEIYLAKISQRRRKPVKPTTVATIRSLLNAATPRLGHVELEAIKNGALRSLADKLYQLEYSANSIQSILATVKMVVASSLDEEGEPKHPRAWKNDFILENIPVERENKPTVLTAQQIESAISHAQSPLREFIATQAATGCRKGELLALRVPDLDSQVGLLHVARTLSRHGETATKTTNGKRDVDLHPEITTMLVAMLAGRTSGRLFDVTIDEVRWGYEKAGIKSHALRHFRYTHLQKCKVHPAIHNYWIGHAMKGMSEVYGHIHEDVKLRRQLVREVGLGFALLQRIGMHVPRSARCEKATAA
jgi:integrase